jgi:hypothetical protein
MEMYGILENCTAWTGISLVENHKTGHLITFTRLKGGRG